MPRKKTRSKLPARVSTRMKSQSLQVRVCIVLSNQSLIKSRVLDVSDRPISSNARVSPCYTKQRALKSENPIHDAPTQSTLSKKRKITPPVYSPQFISQDSPNTINPPSHSPPPTMNAKTEQGVAKETPLPSLHPPSPNKIPRSLSISPSSKPTTDKTIVDIPVLSTLNTTQFTSQEDNFPAKASLSADNLSVRDYLVLLPFHGCCTVDGDYIEFREKQRADKKSMSPWLFSKGAALKIMPGAFADESYHV